MSVCNASEEGVFLTLSLQVASGVYTSGIVDILFGAFAKWSVEKATQVGL